MALVAAEVQDLEGPEVLARCLQLALHADQPLARGVDGELAEVGGDPFAAEFFGHGRGRAGAAEEVGDKIAFVAAGSDDAFEQALPAFASDNRAASMRLRIDRDTSSQMS